MVASCTASVASPRRVDPVAPRACSSGTLRRAARRRARHGGSDGEPDAFGWGSDCDLAAALHWLAAAGCAWRADRRPRAIGRREQLLQAAAESKALEAVVSEGAGYRTLREYVRQGATGTADPIRIRKGVASGCRPDRRRSVRPTGTAVPASLADLRFQHDRMTPLAHADWSNPSEVHDSSLP
jgi:hypothetical protein